MNDYFLVMALIGFAAMAMAWMPSFTKRTGISYALVYVGLGVLLYIGFADYLPVPLPQHHELVTVHLTELVVIISLMGTGIKIDRSFSLKNWASPLKLISVAMVLCIMAAAATGYMLLGMDIASALLLGAVLAPTDPVLASDVQVGPPNMGSKSETRFALTAEAGLNDGMAFPFTWLAIYFAINSGFSSGSLLNWFAYDFIYKIVVGLILGFAMGKFVGYLLFSLSKKFTLLKTSDGFLAISLTLLVYGITELLHGYGFVAVFISAITLRHYEKGHDYHDQLHDFTDQSERMLIAIVLVLFGGALVSGILKPLTWNMVLFTAIFLFIIRPIAAFLSVVTGKFHFKEKLAISFFGIKGMGSIFYLAFAFHKARFMQEDELWAVVAFTILISIIIHGLTATPIMKHLKHAMPHEKVPE